MSMDVKVYCFMSFALLLLSSQGVISQRQCEDNWTHRSGFCYLFSETLPSVQSSDWGDAKQDCTDRSSNLAAIRTEEIWDWIVAQITAQDLGDHWIGLRKTANQFYWDDGTAVDSSNFHWADGGQSQNPNTCVVITEDGWREELCDKSSYFHVCYKKATARDRGTDALVVSISIFASLFILFLLVLLVNYFVPENDVKHEKLDKNVKRADKEEAKRRRQRKGDLESGIQEVENVPSKGQVEKTKVVSEKGLHKERKEGGGGESGRDQNTGVAKGITQEKAKVEKRDEQKDDIKRERSSSKGYDNRAFDNNND